MTHINKYNNCVNLHTLLFLYFFIYFFFTYFSDYRKEWTAFVVCEERETIKKKYIFMKCSVK